MPGGCRRGSLSMTPSTGVATGAPIAPCTTPSSTSCTSRALPAATPTCRPSCAAPTPAWRTPPAIDYLKELGVTAVELLPVHAFLDDSHLLERGPAQLLGLQHHRLLRARRALLQQRRRGEQVAEFKAMVKALHAAGIEVILDVVYNHTAEGNHLGPTLCFRGIDNPSYYRLVADQPRYYMDYTGTGNTLNVVHPQVLQLIMDSLRYWVTEMHVDGFRFDLASALARELHDVDRLGAFFDVIHQDPVLSQVKLIAEPWDVGEGGYQVGNFPAAVERVERQVPRHRARATGRATTASRRARLPPDGIERSLSGRRPPALRQHQLRHRP